MKFWKSGYTPSEENPYLRGVYEIPDYIASMENEFRVKRGVFSWSVTNLSIFPDSKFKDVFCYSPSFRLLDTAWCLQLCPKAKINGQRGISLRLKRDADDPGPTKVVASYRLGLGKSFNNVWFGERETTFWKGGFVQLNTSVLGHLADFFTYGDDNASVVCEIYVSYLPSVSSEIGWEVSEIDESLPADMSALLLTNDQSVDVLIQTRYHQVWVHKSLLSVRSKTLDNKLKHSNFYRSTHSGSTKILQLSCSFFCLKCILSYIYTGSFDYLARNACFSIGLYEMADELCLFPLRDLLYPDIKNNLSRIHINRISEVYICEFNIRHLLSSNTTFNINGKSICGRRSSGLQVSIAVCKIDHLSDYHVGFKLEISGIRFGFHAETSLHLLSRCRKAVVAARFLSQEFDQTGSKLTAIFELTAAEFLSCDVLNNFISAGVDCRLYQMTYGQVTSSGPEARLPSHRPQEPWCWREQLAQDLKTLFNLGYSSDVSMIVDGFSFNVHRSVLCARSPYFQSLFYGGIRGASVVIYNVKPRTFWLMLKYIYCGTLSDCRHLTPEDFVELYRVAWNYGLSSLVGISRIFVNMMTGPLNSKY